MGRKNVYFDDMIVGHRASLGTIEVKREDVIEFAKNYDPQPFHLSDEAAAQTFFGRLSASGWHTATMVMRQYVDHCLHTRAPDAMIAGLGMEDIQWLLPVYPGDTLHCEAELLEKIPSTSRQDRGVTRTRMSAKNQKGEPVITMIGKAMIRRRPQD